MNFSEQPPSREWASLKYRGGTIAEVWFKPEGEPFALTFRIPRNSFQIPGVGQRLTAENLLKAVDIANEDVESWRHESDSHSCTGGPDPGLGHPLPPPPQDVSHLTVHVRLKTPDQVVARDESREPEVPPEQWQDLQARWNAILGLEASVDTLRISMESLRAELESSSKQTLTADEKVHAFNADVLQWSQAKNRVVYALPKVREFIHRSTWAIGTPERKQLEEFFRDDARPHLSVAEFDPVHRLVENLLKDRQALSSQGVAVYQECKSLAAAVQGALRTLKSNAAANAVKKRAAARKKGKFI